MIEIVQSAVFEKWLRDLKDTNARARILARIRIMSTGSMGDAKPVGGGLSEARIHYGPGYRVYFMRRGEKLIVLLVGGDKRTQSGDIAKAKRIAEEWKERGYGKEVQ